MIPYTPLRAEGINQLERTGGRVGRGAIKFLKILPANGASQ